MNEHGHDDRLPEGVAEAGHELGGGYFYRPGELLVAASERDRLRGELPGGTGKPGDNEEQIGNTGLLRLAVDDDVPRLVQDVRSRAVQRGELMPSVSPNHVLFGGFHMQPFPGAAPRPGARAATMPPPPSGEPWPGHGVTVAVLDSGVAEGHPWLGGGLVAHAAVDVEEPEKDGAGRLRRYAGHGTHVAGVVRCHAPGATVLARRLFGADGAVDDVQLALALAELPPEVGVVNLSLGGITHGDAPLPATGAVLRDLAVERPSLVLVASAGNDAMPRPVWPGAFKRVVSVAALGPDGERACFSNFGWWVDACAGGVDVESAFFEVEAEVEPVPRRPGCAAPAESGPQRFEGVAAWSGTSFAAPKVAAAIACAMSLGLDGPEAVFRLVGDSRVPRRADLGAVVDPPCYV